MRTMSKKRPSKAEQSGEPESAGQGRSSVPFSMRMDPALREALDKYCEKSRHKIATAISLALEAFLKAEGFWPPPSPPAPGPGQKP